MRLNRVVLVSSVLPAKFDWRKIASLPHPRVREVRNEIGGLDPIQFLLRIVGILPTFLHLGLSGSEGFQEVQGLVHDAEIPHLRCRTCDASKTRIHNFRMEQFLHSDQFITPGHAKDIWRPYLFGVCPGQYWDFINDCVTYSSYLKAQYYGPEESSLRESLLHERHDWSRGAQLFDWLAFSLDLAAERVGVDKEDISDDHLLGALFIFVHLVADARDQCERKERGETLNDMQLDQCRSIDPLVASFELQRHLELAFQGH